MHVSVVIPTFNRSALLRRTVPALMNQKTDGFTYEVIFVSNGSSDDTGVVLDEMVAQNPEKLRYFYIDPTGGPSAPRNFGIRAATGDVVIILDDDVLPDSDLVLRHVEFHRRHPEQHHAATGEAYVPEEMLSDPMSIFHTFPYHEVQGLERLSYLHFWTCNVTFKRQFMLEKGMFDESFLYYEDVLVAHKLEKNGMHLHFNPAARGQHLHQLKPSGVASKGFFTGLWLHAFEQRIPERVVRQRFGILTPSLGLLPFLRRLLNRSMFVVIDQRLTYALLEALGATNGKRTRVSDFYYWLMFRSNMLRGYAQAKKEARRRQPQTLDVAASSWVNRGES
jgi:glycosyltransferase involved in cell wall biosynthesis